MRSGPRRRAPASRLLALDGAAGAFADLQFRDLPTLLRAGDLLVFNDTRVIPARVHGTKESGGRIELLLERALSARHRAGARALSKALEERGDGDARRGGTARA